MPKPKTEPDAPKESDFLNLPPNVVAQGEAAEAQIKDLQNPGSNEQNTDDYLSPDLNPDNTPEPAQPQESQPAPPAAAPAAQPPAPAAPAIPDSQQEVTFEHKYRVLQGKYDKEIGDLKVKLDDAVAMIERQNKLIGSAPTQPQPVTNTASPVPDLPVFDPDDFEGFGKDIVDLVKRTNQFQSIIKDQQTVITELQNRPAPTAPAASDPGLASRVERIEADTATQRTKDYVDYLDNSIGQKGAWRKINVDKNFHAWLSQPDPMLMVPRGQILTDAANNLRAEQVASIFNQYLATIGKSRVSVADNLPTGQGQNFDFDNQAPAAPDLGKLNDAKQKFINGQITEAEYDKISADYQQALSKQS